MRIELDRQGPPGVARLAEPERYVSRGELAAIMGVSVTTVDRLVRAGMPSETWGLRARRFRPSRAVAWARGRAEGVSIQKLPSGRYRAQVYDAASGKLLSVSKVLGGPGTFRTRTEAQAAREDARRRLRRGLSGVTVAEFHLRWTTDPLFARPKESTNIHNRERTGAFAERYGSLALDHVGDAVVAEWLAGGRRNGTVPALPILTGASYVRSSALPTPCRTASSPRSWSRRGRQELRPNRADANFGSVL